MEEENKVKLHGMWASAYVKRVELALKAKGIPYEYVEEDLTNKSQLLLQYNPVYKKVPLLFHNGKAIAESSVILENIDETWNHEPKLFPDDPFERSQVRFWATFIQQQLFEGRAVVTDGEAQKKAIEELLDNMKIFEEEMEKLYPDGIPIINQVVDLGVLDVLLTCTFGPYKVQEQVIGAKILDPERNPLIFSWVTATSQLALVKKVSPSNEKLVALLQFVRNAALNSSA